MCHVWRLAGFLWIGHATLFDRLRHGLFKTGTRCRGAIVTGDDTAGGV